MSSTAAFASTFLAPLPLRGASPPRCTRRTAPLSPARRPRPFAPRCADTPPPDPQSPDGGSGGKASGKSKTEEIAALLGQSKATMETKAESIYEARRLSNRRKYSLAAGAVAAAVIAFAIEKSNTSSGATLQRYMMNASPALEAVLDNGRPTVVEVSATWCENCRFMAKSVYQLENEFSGRVNFVVLDGDDPKNGRVCDELGVDGIPQFTLLDVSGRIRGNLVGIVPQDVLRQDLDAMVAGKQDVPFPGFDFTSKLSQLIN